jgi:hypothetical protein
MTTKAPPWKKPNPNKKTSTKLTEAEKEEAMARAFKAGRPYPNLIDNMAVARERNLKDKL